MKYTIEFKIPVNVTTADIEGMLTTLGVELVPGAPISQPANSIELETVSTYTDEQLAAYAAAIWAEIQAKAVTITPQP